MTESTAVCRRVIVTGANRGIGRGIATVLAREGFTVGMLARSEHALAELAKAIGTAGSPAYFRACDLRDGDAAERAVAELADAMGGLDALINNAGIVLRKGIYDITPEEWRDVMDTNVNALFHTTRAALRLFRPQGHGHIVNVSSISGKVPLPGGSAYAASKFAVTGFSQSIFQEVRDDGVKVTILYPGSVDSESHGQDPASDPGWKVTPEEVGQACVDVLRTRQGTCISELEIRPLGRPPKG